MEDEKAISRSALKPSRSLSVVIPAYNEVDRLPRTVQEIHSFMISHHYDGEIIVVNDGSRDKTLETVKTLENELPLLRVLSYEQNQGKGFAVKTGMLAAKRDAVLFSDADLSTPIADIDRLWTVYDRGYDVVIGSRAAPESELQVRQALYRETMGKVFNLIVALLAVRGIRDTQCGFKLFRRTAAQSIFSRLKTRGFAFDVEALMIARELGLRIREVGIHWVNSPDSRVHAVTDSVRMLLEILRMRGLL